MDRSQGTSRPDAVTRSDARVAPASTPDSVWRRLAPMLAARRSMRLYDSVAKGFTEARPLTTKRPPVPAAVPLFVRGRARVLALDFDAKTRGVDAVRADVARVLGWLGECGGRAVVDTSTSGGAHVLVPLAPGQSVGVDEVRPLLSLLAARLPTLDIVPMTNPATGCITVPGAACREGGVRVLAGELHNAIDTLTVGSDPAFLPRLGALLGGAGTATLTRTGTGISATSAGTGVVSSHGRAVATEVAAIAASERIVGAGSSARLHPRLCRTAPPPAAVAAFAATGRLDTTRWPSRSEARQSVITHAVLAGDTAAVITDRVLTDDSWAGIRGAYDHYRTPAAAIARDCARALTWAASTLPDPVRDIGHKSKHTGGYEVGGIVDPATTAWLALAQRWVSSMYSGRRDRWTTHAVVQALAWGAAVGGEVVDGVPVVALGGRSLSTAAGLLPETTVWDTLTRMRDTSGSPLLLIERGAGQNADRYALVPAKGVEAAEGESGASTAFAPIGTVHPVWSVVGYRHHVLYDAVVTAESPMTVDALFEHIRIGRSSGYETLLDLRTAGLLTVTGDGLVQRGDTDLDTLADRHGLASAIRTRTVRHRAERIVWREWLDAHERARTASPPPPLVTVDDGRTPPDEGLWDAIMADEHRYRPEHDPYVSLSTFLNAVKTGGKSSSADQEKRL